jgi:protein O-mannosyl-transferase
VTSSAPAKPPLAWLEEDERFTGLLLVLVVVLAYVVGITGGTFHFDDFHNLRENENVRSLANAGRFFTDASTWSAEPGNVMYRPLQVLSYAVDHALWGYRPSGWLLTNALLHAGVAVLTWRLARRLGLAPLAAFLAGLVMALHPVHSEVVNYVSSRSESLAAVLMLGALHLHLTARSRRGAPRVLWAVGAGVLAALSLAAKETTALFFVAVGWMEFVLARRVRVDARLGRALAWTAAYALVFAAMMAVRADRLGHATPDVPGWDTDPKLDHQLGGSISVADNLLKVQSRVVVAYGRLLLHPVGLTVDHGVSRAPVWTESSLLALLLHGAVAVWALAELRRGRRLVPLCVGWFWLFLAPSIAFPLNVVMNEHRLYLPGIAVALFAGAALGRVAELLAARVGVARGVAQAAAPLLLFLVLDVRRSLEWRDDVALWQAAVAQDDTPRARMHLGAAIVTTAIQEEDDGRREHLLRRGLAEYLLAETQHPGWYDLQLNLGHAYLNLGWITRDPRDFEASLAAYRRAGEIIGTSWYRPRYWQAMLLTELGRPDEALDIIRELRQGDDAKTTLYWDAEARILRRKGDRDGARAAMREVIAIEEPEGRVDGLLTLGWWAFEDHDVGTARNLIDRAMTVSKRSAQQGRPAEFTPFLYAARMLTLLGVPGAEGYVRDARRLGWSGDPDELRWALHGAATPGAMRGTRGMQNYGKPR